MSSGILPGTPMKLSKLLLAGIVIAHVVLGLSTVGVLFVYLLARQLWPAPDGLSLTAALLATGLVAFNPMLLFMSGVAQNNTAMLAAGAVVLFVLGRGIRRGFTWRTWVLL